MTAAWVAIASTALGAEPRPLRSTDVDAAVAAWATNTLGAKPVAKPMASAPSDAAARAAFAALGSAAADRYSQQATPAPAGGQNPLREEASMRDSAAARRAFAAPDLSAADRYAPQGPARGVAERLDRASDDRSTMVVATAAADPFAAPPLAPLAADDDRYAAPARPAAKPAPSFAPSTDRYAPSAQPATPNPFEAVAPPAPSARPAAAAPRAFEPATPSAPAMPDYRVATATPAATPAASPAIAPEDRPQPLPISASPQPIAVAPEANNATVPPQGAVQFRTPAAPSIAVDGTAAPSLGVASSSAAIPSAAEGSGRPGDPKLEGPQQATLTVHKRGPREARVGQPCRFIVSVRNTGTAPAEGVVLRDETPAGARLDGAVPPASSEGSQLVWQLGALAPGEEKSVEVRVTPLREGPIGSVASASFATRATATTRVTRPQLAVRMSAAPTVARGEDQTVRIEVTNPGSGTATGVMVVETIPDNLSHEAGDELEFEIGTLEAGKSRSLELVLHAERAGRVVNTLSVTADGGLQAEGRCEFDVVAPELAVAVEGPRRRYLARPASYTVSIGNPGTAAAKDVRLVTHLPKGMDFVRANNRGEYDPQTHAVYWSLAELPQGQRGAVELVALPKAPGRHTLRVEGEASEGLRVEESQELTVEGVASLAFEVRDLEDPIDVGSATEYEVRVTNEGTKSATGVAVRIEAPAGMKPLSAEGQTAHRVLASSVEFAPLAELAPGAEARYRVRLEGREPGDQRVAVLVQSTDLDAPIRREESTRVYGDE
jgi:uncharacterized repeat protein (TIGR01451 family)